MYELTKFTNKKQKISEGMLFISVTIGSVQIGACETY